MEEGSRTSRAHGPARRAEAAAERVAQLQERARRLEQGDPSTAEDVRQARRQAARQGHAAAAVHDDLAQSHRSAERRHTEIARLLDELGRPSEALCHRQAGQFDHACAEGPTRSLAPDAVDATADERSGAELRRLRAALAAVFSWAGRDGTSDDPLRARLSRSVVERAGTAPWRGWSHSVCMVSVAELDGVRGAAVTRFSPDGEPELWAASTPWAWRAEESQHLVGDGPSLTAHRGAVVVHARPLSRDDTRWPGFAAAVTADDIGAVSAYPLVVRGAVVGTLSLYGRVDDARPAGSSRRSSAETREAAAILADIAGVALLADVDGEQSRGVGEVASLVVHVANGLLSSRLDIDPAQAATLLRASAFSRGWPLARLARAVVYGGLDLG